tara:strand:+ start:791 stop:904 length:114 start_codon:yes stop_codon:yes gene_type:complete
MGCLDEDGNLTIITPKDNVYNCTDFNMAGDVHILNED